MKRLKSRGLDRSLSYRLFKNEKQKFEIQNARIEVISEENEKGFGVDDMFQSYVPSICKKMH